MGPRIAKRRSGQAPEPIMIYAGKWSLLDDFELPTGSPLTVGEKTVKTRENGKKNIERKDWIKKREGGRLAAREGEKETLNEKFSFSPFISRTLKMP